jgi:hypothetical protein
MKKIHLYSLIISLATITGKSVAQDTIFFKNNQRVPANVIEVSTSEVRYKRFEVVDGPTYVERKSKILKIKYKNGFTDEFPASSETEVVTDEYRQSDNGIKYPERKEAPKHPDLSEWGRGKYMYGDKIIGERKMQQTLLSLNDVKINEQIIGARQSRAMKYIGFAAIPLGIASAIYAIRADNSYFFYSRSLSAYTRDRYKKNSIVLGAGAAVCIGASIYFGVDRKIKNRKAVELYEQHYANK